MAKKITSKAPHVFADAEQTFGGKRWDDTLDRAVQMATLGSIAFLAASSAPNINPKVTAAHPSMIHFFLIGALLFVFCASARLITAFVKEKRYTYRFVNFIIHIAAIVGVICFFIGGLLAVIYLVF